ncbi:CUGBP Elav-like family member 2 isoform X1 [Limulus polyphemus]|uniref:CUGBP Elav-like family member 2 isoform X1 n=1 Tax=Limulus polyphemus TaxID=6850 RepID=A0ABM1B253_LIMPO|nr:CUGBP Elav-like family member 2 isoform X1 [Limulus polyphemus]XP_022240289.1 CUGBP Elav-like family member 2 isoform X1 [Limulus polyphemus]
MTYRSIEVKPLNRRLSRRLKAKAVASAKGAYSQKFLQTFLTTIFKSRGLSPAAQLPSPLQCLALLMQHPIQMKPAESETKNGRKLFIGMLSKKFNENDVRRMFSPFGFIEECTVLRDVNGQSKGCGFVTYATRQFAINAIKGMNHFQTMEGCSSPLVVKFADTQKEKDQKRKQQIMANLWNTANFGNVSSLTPQYLALLHQAAQTGTFGNFNNLQQSSGGECYGVGSLNVQQQLAVLAAAQASNNSSNSAGVNSMMLQNLAALAAAGGGSNSAGIPGISAAGGVSGNMSSANSSFSGMNSMSPNMAMGITSNSLSNMENLSGMNSMGNRSGMVTNGPNIDPFAQAYSGMPQYQSALPGNFSQVGLHQNQSSSTRQVEGPEGANLFIYHLPQDFTDNDLAQTFLPFGNVISVKVFIDKQTNLSKCFGFVSYDNPVSAQAAIQAMNGFEVGTKRLKVQLKRSKEGTKA